jgi:type IV pilus assembly protein PilA
MRRLNKGFSLVELMIVVAIIGILAAIAIPNYIKYQLSAKRSEVNGAVDGIKNAEAKYDAEHDGYLNAAVQPRDDGALNKAQTAWVTTATDWISLGWAPDGNVRGNYVVVVTAASGTSPETYTITGKSDVDDDSQLYVVTATPTGNAAVTSGTENYY